MSELTDEQNQVLRLELDEARTRLVTMNAEAESLRAQIDSERQNLAHVNKQIAAKDRQIDQLLAETARLKSDASAENFELRVAQKVCELGISTTAITQPKAGKAVIPTSPTSGGAPAGSGGEHPAKNYTELAQAHIADHGQTPITSGFGLPK